MEDSNLILNIRLNVANVIIMERGVIAKNILSDFDSATVIFLDECVKINPNLTNDEKEDILDNECYFTDTKEVYLISPECIFRSVGGIKWENR
jgi:hypothetical protein